MSVDISDSTTYAVIILTNLYAGNFERELTAYCTGRIGECEVGDEMMEMFNSDFGLTNGQDCPEDPFWDSINCWVTDDAGCHRPCTIYNHGNKRNYNDVAIFFQGMPTKKQLHIIEDRAQKYATDPRVINLQWKAQPDLKIKGIKVLAVETKVWPVETRDLPEDFPPQ